MPTTFLRLLAADDKAAAMRAAVAAINTASPASDIYTVDPASFRQIPGSPFAYWVSERILQLFTDLPPFDSNGRAVRVGLQTGDDFRFVRAWWEVSPTQCITGSERSEPSDFVSQTFAGKQWVPFAKGGAYSPYYADIHLLVWWEHDGKSIKNFVDMATGKALSRPQNTDYYFRPGLTWSDRTTRLFSARTWPAGGVFSVKGSAGFFPHMEDFVLGLMNTSLYNWFLALMVGAADKAARSYQVGTIGQVPFPQDLPSETRRAVGTLAREAHDLKREDDRNDEVTHPFTAPALVQLGTSAGSLAGALAALAEEERAREQRLAEIQREIDDRCFALYGFSDEDRAQVLGNAGTGANSNGEADSDNGDEADETEASEEDESARPQGTALASRAAADLLMYAVGCAFGRWDVRIGHDPSLAPKLAAPFAPLPVCAPGVLVGVDGLPAAGPESIVSEEWQRDRPNAITLPEPGTVNAPTIAVDKYPIPVAWDGILVDDSDAQDDIVRRVRAALDYLWGERADAVEREACAMLGVQDLRNYLRNPRGFFDFHISRYSKSRRKAPNYWLLQSPKRQYGIWLYYHRLDADLVFKSLNFHLLPKIRLAEQRLTELETIRKAAGTTGSEARRAAQAVERQETLLADLREFYAALDRAAKLYLKPDLNDGVLLNIAPFWEVVPWKEAKFAWQQLLAGKYEWSSIGKQMREKGLVKG